MIVEMTIPGQWMVIYILSIVNLCFLLQLIQINKTLIMDSEGCTVKLWKISKVYSWNELKIKRIEKFTRKNEGWTQGVVFCKHTIFKPKSIHPENYAFLAPFLSYFFVCFIEEDDEKKTNNAQAYSVNENEFMEKMRLWNVELEDCRK